jgi:sec-independent protein translocase protein TatA
MIQTGVPVRIDLVPQPDGSAVIGLDNPLHLAFLLVILLMVFGAKRLPEMGKSLGAGLRGFKDSINGHTPADELPATLPAHEHVGQDSAR